MSPGLPRATRCKDYTRPLLSSLKTKSNHSQPGMRLTKDAEAPAVLKFGFLVIKYVHRPYKPRVLLFCRVRVIQKPQQIPLEESAWRISPQPDPLRSCVTPRAVCPAKHLPGCSPGGIKLDPPVQTHRGTTGVLRALRARCRRPGSPSPRGGRSRGRRRSGTGRARAQRGSSVPSGPARSRQSHAGPGGARRGSGGPGAAAGGGAGPAAGAAAPAVLGLQAAVPAAPGPRLLPPLRRVRLLRPEPRPRPAPALLPPQRQPRPARLRRLCRAPAGPAVPGETPAIPGAPAALRGSRRAGLLSPCTELWRRHGCFCPIAVLWLRCVWICSCRVSSSPGMDALALIPWVRRSCALVQAQGLWTVQGSVSHDINSQARTGAPTHRCISHGNSTWALAWLHQPTHGCIRDGTAA